MDESAVSYSTKRYCGQAAEMSSISSVPRSCQDEEHLFLVRFVKLLTGCHQACQIQSCRHSNRELLHLPANRWASNRTKPKPGVREANMVNENVSRKEASSAQKLRKLSQLIESLCGLYTRIARRLGVHRSMVSRVARGERRSEPIETALLSEYDRLQE